MVMCNRIISETLQDVIRINLKVSYYRSDQRDLINWYPNPMEMDHCK